MPQLTRQLVFRALVFGFLTRATKASIIYVNMASTGGNGTSWHSATPSLSSAVAMSRAGDQIWVAGGIYRPGAFRTDTFALKDDVQIYGGFEGTEDPSSYSLEQRNLHQTILEGEIGAPGPSDNVFHVVTAASVSRKAVLDGFTVTHGTANGLSMTKQDVGGAMLITNASPTIRNCLFHESQAGSRGGAVHIASGSPYFAHCRFVANSTVVTQAANNFGGAIFYAGITSATADPVFVNCLFVGNRAGSGAGGTGGALYGGAYAQATLTNCTLLHNRADTLTAGVFGSATITNCILHGNRDHNGFEPTAQLRGAITASRSLIQGGWAGGTNLSADPLFASPLGSDGIAGTLDDDARLLPGSPCLDAGSNYAWPADLRAIDLDGASRFMNDPLAPDAGEPMGAAIADMGAFERQASCTDDEACNDGLFCDGLEFCDQGVCRAGDSADCSDGVDCTSDRCIEADHSCAHEPDAAWCDDGQYCNGVESCDETFGCVPSIPPGCNDGVDCTFDECDPQLDGCVHTPDHAACDDEDVCNGIEACDPLQGCISGSDPCDDNIDCTTDNCDIASQLCAHVPDTSLCDDGIFCNGSEICAAGGCMDGSLPCEAGQTCNENLRQCILPSQPDAECIQDADCADTNPCSNDSCQAGACIHLFHSLPCDDGDACTTGDRCTQGACMGTPVADCGNVPPDPDPDDQPPVGGDDPPEEHSPDTGSDDGGAPDPDDDGGNDNSNTPELPPSCAAGQPCNEGPDAQAPDTDEDGVSDEQDQCPDTLSGLEVDASGCSMLDPQAGRGTWITGNQRRCGACGSMGMLGLVTMVCLPATILVTGRTRGRKRPST